MFGKFGYRAAHSFSHAARSCRASSIERRRRDKQQPGVQTKLEVPLK
jgi:hypothetical protein